MNYIYSILNYGFKGVFKALLMLNTYKILERILVEFEI